ncbi:uncharacterized protein [Argopecten irradians]|uniref:uncharacterized protein n=1 Tax=Argopecten irradians TaxID=31199 RepID=UPI003719604C
MLIVVEMGKVVLYLVMVVRVSSFFGYTTNGITGVYPQTTSGLVVPGNTSCVVCLILCMGDINCMSIFTNAGKCHLFYNGFVDNTVLSPAPGWNLYNVFSGGCPYMKGYIENRNLNICYKMHMGGPSNVYDFMATCASEGGELLRITSKEIQDHIAAFLANVACYDKVFIQGSDQTTEGTFRFDDGSLMTYFNWADSDPNNAEGNEHFIVIDVFYQFVWFDTKDIALSKSSFICEIDMA